jgi:hypothetical protein
VAEQLGLSEDVMGAECGWIGDPPAPVEWRDSHYSREAERIAARDRVTAPVIDDEMHD